MENWSFKCLGWLLLLLPACGKARMEMPPEPLVFQTDYPAFSLENKAEVPLLLLDGDGMARCRIRSRQIPMDLPSKTDIVSSLDGGFRLTCTKGPEGAEAQSGPTSFSNGTAVAGAAEKSGRRKMPAGIFTPPTHSSH